MKNKKHKLKIKNKKVFLIFCLCFLFLMLNFSFSYAQTKTLKNIGFIQENIWYSKDPFFEMDKIRIYTAVFNGSQYDFKAVLEFFAGGKLVGKPSVSLVSGASQVLWADWTAEGGNKKIFANITDARISLPGGAEEIAVLENSKTGEVETFVDKDTDKDGIGNKVDTDDDGDKISDSVEQKQGTNPLVAGTAVPAKSTETIPEPKEVAESAKTIVVAINDFLDEQKEKATVKKEELKQRLGDGESIFEFDFLGFDKKEAPTEVGVTTSSEDGAVKNKDLLRLYLLALSALIFSLEYKVFAYLFGIYIVYRVLKFFVKRLFFRRRFE